MPATSIRSQPFILHDDNDIEIKNSTVLIKTISKGVYCNYRYFEGSNEPKQFDLKSMSWTEYLRVEAQILPTAAKIDKTIVQYSGYGQDITKSDDQNNFDLQYKSLVPAYIVRRFEFYGLNSDVYLTDNNVKSFDTYVNRRAIYSGSHDFGLAKGTPYLTAPKFQMTNYRSMGYDNRIEII